MHKSVDPASRSGLSFNASSPRSGLTAFLIHLKINVAKDEFSFTLNLLPTSPLLHFPEGAPPPSKQLQNLAAIETLLSSGPLSLLAVQIPH